MNARLLSFEKSGLPNVKVMLEFFYVKLKKFSTHAQYKFG